jgi:hypothetical protein
VSERLPVDADDDPEPTNVERRPTPVSERQPVALGRQREGDGRHRLGGRRRRVVDEDRSDAPGEDDRQREQERDADGGVAACRPCRSGA